MAPLQSGIPLAVQALNTVEALGKKAAPLKDRIAALPEPKAEESSRIKEYTQRMKELILANLS